MPRLRLVRCAIYTRQSVARPGGDPTTRSCALQRAACLDLIASNGPRDWVSVRESFDDEGESGATAERPGLERLLVAITEGRVERVVVHRLDRLTRSLSDWLRIYQTFRMHRVCLSVVHGDLHDTDDATTHLRLNILALFAELERDMIAERLRDSRAARRARGMRVAGRVPLGYLTDRTTKQLVVVPTEAETVRRMFANADAGDLPATIAARANEAGAADKDGKTGRWSAKAVLRILRNPVYAGVLSNSSPGVHAAVVSREVFDRVGAAIEGRRTRAPTRRPAVEGELDPFLLRGLLVCTSCGKRMTTSSSRKIVRPQWDSPRYRDTVPRYYRCRGPSACPGSQVPSRAIESCLPQIFANPPSGAAEDVRAVFLDVAQMWEALMFRNRRAVLVSLCRELHWDGAGGSLTIVLDDEGVTNWIAGWSRTGVT